VSGVKRRYFIRSLVSGIAVTAMAAGGGVAYAVTQAPAVTGGPVTGVDHLRFTFTLNPGASQVIKLPALNDPIRIDLDEVSSNGGVQAPSQVFSALVNVNKIGGGMSWIGTYSDGTQHAGTSNVSSTITQFSCGGTCLIARLNVASTTAHTVILRTNSATSTTRETYVVNIWF
jgi:hypothetical protein